MNEKKKRKRSSVRPTNGNRQAKKQQIQEIIFSNDTFLGFISNFPCRVFVDTSRHLVTHSRMAILLKE